METIIYQVDAFTDKPFCGNPAGVVPDAEGLSEKDMQRIANEMNLSETAFAKKIGDNCFEIRFFTPNSEVDLCGHATIATFFVLGEKGYIRAEGRSKVEVMQKTKVGMLPVELYFKENKVTNVLMVQDIPKAYEYLDDLEEISEILGIKKEQLNINEFNLRPQIISTGLKDIMVPVKDETILKSLEVDFRKLESFCEKTGTIGMHVFTVDLLNEGIVYCRNFAPLVGINEEAATGTANGALVYYLKENNILKGNNITAKQGIYMNRPSEIKCEIHSSKYNKIIKVGGKAIIVLEGVLKI